MIADALFELDLVDPQVAAGEDATGVLRVVAPAEVQRVTLELCRTELSAKAPAIGPTVVRSVQLAGTTSLTAGQAFEFAMTVPADVTPSLRTPNGSVGWIVRARADVVRRADPAVTAALTVLAPVTRPPASTAAVERLAAGPLEQEQRSLRTNARLGWTFFAIGVAFVLLTAVWAGSPPEAWGDSRSMLFVSGGIGVFLAAVGGFVVWRTRRVELTGVTVSIVPPVCHASDTVVARVDNATGATLQVGCVSSELVLFDRRVGNKRAVDHLERLISHAWQPLPPGAHEFSFVVPADSPPSYVGTVVSVNHQVLVVRGSTRRALNARARLRHRFVVLP